MSETPKRYGVYPAHTIECKAIEGQTLEQLMMTFDETTTIGQITRDLAARDEKIAELEAGMYRMKWELADRAKCDKNREEERLRERIRAERAEAELAKRQWVLVSERLPPMMVPVITTDGKIVRGAYRTGDATSWSAWAIGTCTHWMPLPTPPENAP